LSAQDSSFVKFEGEGIPVHIAAIARFDEPSADDPEHIQGGTATPHTPGGFPHIDRIREHVASRLHLIPHYRRRLAFTPLQGHPIWVDDEAFDLSYHVRHAALPRPGTNAQLHEFASQVISQPLDLSRPLWELWLVEGLADGGFAMVAKIHHCMVDGVSGVGVMTALFSPDPRTTVDPAPAWKPRPSPSVLQFLSDGVEGGARLGVDALRSLSSTLLNPIDTASVLLDTAAMGWDTLRAGLTPPAETPLTAPIGRQRLIDCRRLDLAEIRDVRKRLDGSVNDVVLTIVAGAMRSFLKHRRVKLGGLNFRVVVPVDTRTGDEDEGVGNRVSAWFLSLPLAERNVRRRFLKIRSQTRQLKRSGAERGVDAFLRFADWSGSTRLPYWGVSFANWVRPYNMIVTNVHGPQVPLYLLGSRLREFTPAIPLFQNQGLAVAAMSYLGGIHFGITGDRNLVPDLELFGDALEASFEELKNAAENL
jgi:WS/DGAT/MGAT family acyltransferase